MEPQGYHKERNTSGSKSLSTEPNNQLCNILSRWFLKTESDEAEMTSSCNKFRSVMILGEKNVYINMPVRHDISRMRNMMRWLFRWMEDFARHVSCRRSRINFPVVFARFAEVCNEWANLEVRRWLIVFTFALYFLVGFSFRYVGCFWIVLLFADLEEADQLNRGLAVFRSIRICVPPFSPFLSRLLLLLHVLNGTPIG